MPTFRTLIQARKYAEKNYLTPLFKESNRGNWKVFEGCEILDFGFNNKGDN